jgi:hypothetical protein
MRNPSPSSGQNCQLVHWWVLAFHLGSVDLNKVIERGFDSQRFLMLWTIHQLEATGGQAASPEYSYLCIK